MKRKREKFRMDFTLEKFEPIPGKENTFRIKLVPDPRMWELIEHEGREAWYNKIERAIILMDEFEKAVKTMNGIPIVVSSIEVEAIGEYIEKSKKRTKEDIS